MEKITEHDDIYYFYVAISDSAQYSDKCASIAEAIASYEDDFGIAPDSILGVLNEDENGEYEGDTVWDVYEDGRNNIQMNADGESEYLETEEDD